MTAPSVTSVDVFWANNAGTIFTGTFDFSSGWAGSSQTTKNQSRSILVAEDEHLLRLYAADLLEEYGFEVVEIEDAASALSVMENRPDVRLLFTDIQMPGRFDGIGPRAAGCLHARLAFCW